MGVLNIVLIVCVIFTQLWKDAQAGSEKELERRQGGPVLVLPRLPSFPTVPVNMIPTYHPCTPTGTRDNGRPNDYNSGLVSFANCGVTRHNTKRNFLNLIGTASINQDKSKRVVGGAPSLEGMWPWLVSILIWTPQGYRHHCTGSLISNRWVLTAAHCFHQSDSICKYAVQLGEMFILNPNHQGMQVLNVDKIIKHPYSTGEPDQPVGTPINNDVALLRLAGRVVLSGDVNTVCLRTPGEPIVAGTCWIAGWGFLSPQSHQTLIAHHLNIQPASTQQCSNFLASLRQSLGAGKLCLSNYKGLDACNGDSGGPWVCKSAVSGRWIQIGITSYGVQPCGLGISPTVYTDTAYHLGWIDGIIYRNGGV